MALVNDIPFVIGTIPAIPLGMAVDTLFLFVFIFLLPKGLLLSAVASLAVWFGFAALAVQAQLHNLICNTMIYVFLTALLFLYLHIFPDIRPVKKSRKSYSATQIILRAAFAGTIVSSVILVSKFFSPYLVGIISTFPAVLLSTIIILYYNQNADFARATGKILMLSSSNIVVYAIAVYFTYPLFGLLTGTIISFLLAFAWVWIFYPFILKFA